jgi:tRNA A-37 threonylcarbamoyl transferase component Bud32
MSDERTSPADPAADLAVASGQLAPGFEVGGKYVIKRLLGEGANGSVYEGEHSQIGHRVAIKVVHPALAARDDIIARFQREARICGTIRNRHVGQVYDVGVLPDGAPYMVMELHEGRSLAQVLAIEGPLPIATVVDLARQLLLGLRAAHETSVVHRDVKPDNIMLVRESTGQTVVKLVDFGIGKSIQADIRERNVTREGAVVGSPDYMPPEQLRGEAVDHRADLYAMGVVLYEAVTGRVPFNAESLTELFVAILRDPVAPPRQYRPDCPPELEAVIMRALSREAGQRYASAADMERALELVQRSCVLPTGAGTLERLSQPPPAAQPQRRASTQGYALETERVRTAELQVPLQRPGERMALVAGAALLGAVGIAWGMRGSQDSAAPEHRVAPAAVAAMPAQPVMPAVAQPAAQPSASAEPTAVAIGEAAKVPTEPASPGADHGPRSHAHEDAALKHRAAHGGPARSEQSARAQPAEVKPSAPRAPDAPKPATVPDGLSAAELSQQAAAAFVRGQMPRARALYREATQKAPGDAAAWRGLGMVSSRMGEREEAARAFKRYLALSPGAADADAIRKKLSEL